MKSNQNSDMSKEDQEEENSTDKIDKFFMDKENNKKIYNNITSNNIEDKFASYVKTILKTQKYLK
ncbi:19408_t:CDS:2 [Funneliformis geosporum]|uniref:19408_t:CDS:1 n=1 Tax=Funneliformis geosporum TaxID=1117311 RepID=A0A9W4SRP6_9GLOM|nr:19408_t:CDS:2 [Funneliformis geosporum]